MGSARGRTFLQEYALRNRVADTATLLTAIGRIEGLLTSRAGPWTAETAPSSGAPLAEAPLPEAPLPEAPLPEAPLPEAAAESDVEPAIIEGTEPKTIPPEVQSAQDFVEMEIARLEGTALQVLAIEFLGPQLMRAREAASGAPIPQDIPARPATRDPFADIQALSPEEKIALFA